MHSVTVTILLCEPLALFAHKLQMCSGLLLVATF
jgi:hypothetical protein